MIEGRQFRFQLEGVWRSEIAPQPGQVVEVELDRQLQVVGLSVITEPQAMNLAVHSRSDRERPHPGRMGILARLYGKVLGRHIRQEMN